MPAHSRHHPNPNKLLRTQCSAFPGVLEAVGVEVVVGEGSTQIRPNHSLELQVSIAVELSINDVGIEGGDVIGCDVDVVEVASLQPKNKPGVSQVGVDEWGDVVVGSLHPPK